MGRFGRAANGKGDNHTVIIYPAIDIRGGKCVRLVEGDFERETIFDDDPVEAARRWTEQGAQWLHLVDLDGARRGEPVNTATIERIRGAVSVPIQLGGGMRTSDHVDSAMSLGINRVVLGTAALEAPDLVENVAHRYPGRIAVGLDARSGRLATAGWLEVSNSTPEETARLLMRRGIETFVFTDISRDGTLAGPNLAALRSMATVAGNGLIASGGIGSIDHVTDVAETGVSGLIIGRALYDGRVGLAEAIMAAQPRELIES